MPWKKTNNLELHKIIKGKLNSKTIEDWHWNLHGVLDIANQNKLNSDVGLTSSGSRLLVDLFL